MKGWIQASAVGSVTMQNVVSVEIQARGWIDGEGRMYIDF